MSTEQESQPTLSKRVKQPNSNHCFACGLDNPHGLALSFYELGPDRLESRYSVPDRFEGYPGIVHGGIIASMLDEIVSRTAMIGQHDEFMMTARLEIKYRQPVPTHVELQLLGFLARRKGRTAFARGEVRLPDGTLGAEAEATLIRMPGGPHAPDLLKSLGWRVRPDEEDAAEEEA